MTEFAGHILPKLRTEYGFAFTRILMGWLFLWAFLDKLFGFGFATESGNSWINGGSPTAGYLEFATSGPLSGFYQSISGDVLVDTLFMLALLALGTALILGIGLRIAFYGGTLLLLMLWSTNLPPENNPIIDEHIIYISVLFILERVRAGQILGLGDWWKTQKIVKRFPILE